MDECTYVIDRLHVQGHVAVCKENYSPKLYSDLDTAKTMVCEQRNFWVSGFKHNVKHMNEFRFIFFLFIIFDYFNEVKCVGLINIANTNDVYKPSKRLITAIESSDEENSENLPLDSKRKKA